MPYYHCSHRDLKTGDIIETGNWGNVLFNFGPTHSSWRREMVLEAIRTTNFPHKPSRFKSTFACETIDAIRFHRLKNTNPDIQHYIYEVEPAYDPPVIHKGDFNGVEPIRQEGFEQNDYTVAINYWKSASSHPLEDYPDLKCWEFVIGAPLRIIAKITL
jgi:hypothetical protein